MRKVLLVFVLFGLFSGALNKSKAQRFIYKYENGVPVYFGQPSIDSYEDDPITSVLGVAMGTPVSIVASTARGSSAKAKQYAGSFSRKLTPVVGAPLGYVTGLVTGGVTGIMKGTFNGVLTGVDRPFTEESVSMHKTRFAYEPYRILPPYVHEYN